MKEKLFTRNFTLLLVGQASSLLGNNTLKFALSMFVLEETGSATVFATILALAMAPTILLSPLGGILADRANRKSIMVALDSLSGLAVLMACLLLSLGDRVLVVGALLVALSILGAFESPTVQACVPQMLSGERLLQGNAAVSQIQAAASLVTPFLGSVLYTALGIQPIFLGAVACFFLTALLECFLQLDYRRPSRQAGVGAALRKDLSESMEFLIRQEPGICKLLLLAALVSLFVSGAMVVGFPYLVRTVLDLSAALYGIAESALGVAAVLGGVCVGLLGERLRLGRLAGVFSGFGLCLLPCGLAFLLPLGALGRYGVLLVFFCICQAGCSVFSTCAISAIQARTPERLMGKVMSFVFTLSLCAQPLGQLLYGVLFDTFSHAPWCVLLPTGLAVWAAGMLSRRFFRRLERQWERPGPAQNPPPKGRGF